MNKKVYVLLYVMVLLVLSSFAYAEAYYFWDFKTAENSSNLIIENISTDTFYWNASSGGHWQVFDDYNADGFLLFNLSDMVDDTVDWANHNVSLRVSLAVGPNIAGTTTSMIGCSQRTYMRLADDPDEVNGTFFRFRADHCSMYRMTDGGAISCDAPGNGFAILNYYGIDHWNNGSSYVQDANSYDGPSNSNIATLPDFYCGVVGNDHDSERTHKYRIYNMSINISSYTYAPPPPEGINNITTWLNSPTNDTINNTGTNIVFNYNVTSVSSDIDNCSLYLNESGIWGINETITVGITNDSANIFTTDLTEGSWLWNVECLSVDGNSSFTSGSTAPDNRTLTIDLNTTVVLSSPINNSINATSYHPFRYTPTSESENIDNCSLYINSSSGWSINSTNSTPSNNTINNIYGDLSEGYWLWNVECCLVGGDCDFAMENYTLTIDTTSPPISADSIRFNQSFTYDVINAQINVSDDNLYSINVTVNGTTYFNISNMELTSYQYNLSYNLSTNLTEGIWNITFRACDGHTNSKLKDDWEIDIGLTGLKYTTGEQWFRINPENSDFFESFETNKLKDRYSFSYSKSWMGKLLGKDAEYNFIVESSEKIDIVERKDRGYNAWLVIPTLGTTGRWIDFNTLTGGITYKVKRVSDKKVRVILLNVPEDEDVLLFESVGELNCNEETYLVYKYDYSTDYTTRVLENQLSNFTLNVTVDDSFIKDINATLTYNNTVHTAVKTNESSSGWIYFNTPIYADNLTVNSTNVSFQWNFSLFGDTLERTNTTNSSSQEIFKVSIDNCTDFSTPAINFTLKNESDLLVIEGDIDTTLSYSSYGLDKTYSMGVDSVNGTSLCIYPNWINISADILLQYSSSLYDTRQWEKASYVMDNETDYIDLYLLLSALSTEVNVQVVNENDDGIEDVMVEVYKYNVDTNNYTLVSVESTGVDGNSQFQLEVGSTYYQFQFYIDGELKLTSSTFKITDTTLKYTIGQTISSPLIDWLKSSSIAGDVVYLNTTQTFNFTWNDLNSYATLIAFNVTDGNSSYYTITSTSDIGSFAFPITELNKTYTATGYAKIGGRWYELDSSSVNLKDFWRTFGKNQSIMISMIFIMLMSLAALKSPQLAVGMACLAIVSIFFMGMLPIGPKALISIVAVGVILLTIMKERFYQ